MGVQILSMRFLSLRMFVCKIANYKQEITHKTVNYQQMFASD